MSTDDDEQTGGVGTPRTAPAADSEEQATAYPSLAPAGFVPRVIRRPPEPNPWTSGVMRVSARRAAILARTFQNKLPPPSECDLYVPGHTPHYIQWRLARDSGVSERRTIVDVADDGTVTFAEGEPVWNHDPERIRAAVAAYGPTAEMGSSYVMKVNGSIFSVASEASPCVYDFEAVDDDGNDPYADESIVEATLRKGGALMDGRAVLAQMERRGLIGAAGDDPE